MRLVFVEREICESVFAPCIKMARCKQRKKFSVHICLCGRENKIFQEVAAKCLNKHKK